ncbi:hypothetical protein SLS53_009314 [Cytospora paraplurivora]|uniref:Rhodopsin domain-containing protein n=1 Tax=Cytospora paraplurivora TaxID=2898453 RepID=A0AAN9TYB0_9PEZI
MAPTSPQPTFTPYLRPPAGVIPNPDHPESLAHLADITIGLCLSFVTTFFIARCYVRIFLKRVWIFEDSLVTLAWAGAVAYCGIMRATMSHHGGQHGWDMTAAEAHEASYWFNVAAIEYGVMIGLTKCSVLVFYRRVFSPIRWSWFDITIVALIILMVGFYGSITIAKILECQPRDKIWNNSLPGKCIQIALILNISGGFNTVTDYIILLLPVHAVWRLQMNKTKRILVVLAFTFGLCGPMFATAGFVVRLQNSTNKDTTWKQPDILLWGAAELATGNLCVCFPEVAFLFRKKNRKSAKARQRPTATELDKAWNERAIRKPADPYFTNSLASTVFNGKSDGEYIQLQDRGNHAYVTPLKTLQRREEPDSGVIVLQNEYRVELVQRSV